ncbi:protein MEI2-like 1 isoform X3 [Vigna radiata var. radiata]|uniref:Protein MEI2-like 1 isoform X3 n=1 Tax=Vigna radiata var. radiata TaxID=3916 RepID=A0A3Q0EQL7_VIGRR|nr:protein MEI2-like 1 isoform X3 [Vigna radiata var. radiata]
MPSEIMEKRGVSASSHFLDDISYASESIGLRKPKSIHDHFLQGKSEMAASPGSILNTSSPRSTNAKSGLPISHTTLSGEITGDLHFGREAGTIEMLKDSTESLNYTKRSWSNVHRQPASSSYGLIGSKLVTNATSRESSLFSSSLSEVFNQKMRLLGNGVPSGQPITVGSLPREEPHKSLGEIEADTIGNLLPDEDDLFSGVTNELGCSTRARMNDDFEDFDLFSSSGGMELEGDDELLISGKGTSFIYEDPDYFGASKGKIPFGEQSSRTLFVRNINSNVEDSELKALFEQYGDIRTIYTACKHRGFVMISYYDLRAAQNAMKALQNRSLRFRKLDIHYSIPKGNAPEKDIGHGTLMISDLDSSVLNDELKQIFGFYGEIRDIYEYPQLNHVKFMEFYDVRAAEASLRALNGICFAGKHIKLEPGHPMIATCMMQQSQKGQDEPDLGHSLSDNISLRHKAGVSSGFIASAGSLENGYNQGFHSAAQLPAFIDNSLFNMNSNIHKTARGASTGKVSGIFEASNTIDAMKFASVSRFHPHSLPEYRDSLANGSPYNYSSTINMAANIGNGSTESSESRKIQGINSTGNLAEFNAGGNGNCSNHGLYHMWNGSNLHQQPPSNAMLWQKTPSFVNGAGSPCLPQIPSFPRTPPHVLRASHIDHQVGSAPVVTASPWERQHSYLGESPDGSGFRLGSVGSPGFHGSWQMHPPASHNIFSHVSGNGTELTSNNGQGSPKQLSHVLPGRLPMNLVSKFDSSNERMRNLYPRRNEPNTNNNADKKQYELDLGRILRGDDSRTTLMIKNIPNKYTSKMLLAAIDEQCRGTYDFLYLPIDFKNKCNVGYAFINMIDPGQIIPFHKAFNGKKWEKFNSEKVAVLAYARIQGKAALIAHFQNSSLMNEDKRCRPILFHTDGPNAGDPEPFPLGNNIRVRPGKSRANGSEENRSQGNPSSFASGEESGNGMESSSISSKNSD